MSVPVPPSPVIISFLFPSSPIGQSLHRGSEGRWEKGGRGRREREKSTALSHISFAHVLLGPTSPFHLSFSPVPNVDRWNGRSCPADVCCGWAGLTCCQITTRLNGQVAWQSILSIYVSYSHAPRGKRDKVYVHDTYINDDPLTVFFSYRITLIRKRKRIPVQLPLPPSHLLLSIPVGSTEQPFTDTYALLGVGSCAKQLGHWLFFILHSFCSTHEECMKKTAIKRYKKG